ncbi:hypothetical protein QG516_23225 [Pedobacter gandavensis]|uniref:hypothetical protein n=1 Tax=Pedobacter gandavensis TaxID=2679963 RepID=UPI0024785A5F|nr:hypothetical protein [Pedobacter gandavensis]WGQ09432.1 hypothetical protein QG516_23225 [Pedobacter gandavensis]
MNDHFWHPTEKETITKSGSILTVEIRHSLLSKEADHCQTLSFYANIILLKASTKSNSEMALGLFIIDQFNTLKASLTLA